MKYKITISEMLAPSNELDKFGRKKPTERILSEQVLAGNSGRVFMLSGRREVVVSIREPGKTK